MTASPTKSHRERPLGEEPRDGGAEREAGIDREPVTVPEDRRPSPRPFLAPAGADAFGCTASAMRFLVFFLAVTLGATV